MDLDVLGIMLILSVKVVNWLDIVFFLWSL